MREALAALDEAMDRCLSVPLFARTSEELVGYLDRLQAHQQRVAAVQAAVVRGLRCWVFPAAKGATSTLAWLRSRYRISGGSAKRLVSLAHITGAPAVTAALAAGNLNAEQAQVISDTIADVPPQVRPKPRSTCWARPRRSARTNSGGSANVSSNT